MNGVNLLRLHSTHPYGYALTLLDTLFTREEQNQCLMFNSKKSGRPGLDPVKVEKMLGEFICIIIIIIVLIIHLHVYMIIIHIVMICIVVYMCTCTCIHTACINKKYSNTEWDMKVLIQKVNQKCRDALKKTA